MKKIVLLTGDDKLLKDMTQWLGDVTEEIIVEGIADLETFYSRYCTEPQEEESESKDASASGENPDAEAALSSEAEPASETPPAASDEVDIGEKAERHFPSRLVIADLETVLTDDLDPVEWVVQAKAAMSEFGYSLPETPTRFFLLGTGEQGTPSDKFRHDTIDDLMQKPLDKSVFLQKVEIHLSDPGTHVRPSFLFMQKTDLPIEMGKDTFIESVSEFGFTIRNPAPLSAGVYAKVYSPVFGVGESAALIGRVYHSERHPTESNAYLCSLTYHGVTTEQMNTLRKIIRAEKIPHNKSKKPAPRFDSQIKNIAVVDLNGEARHTIRDSLESNFTNAQVFEFPSYSAFLRFCQARMKQVGAPPVPEPELAEGELPKAIVYAEKVFGGANEITLNVDAVSGNLISFDPAGKKELPILGFDAGDFKARPDAWLSVFGESEKEVITEYLTYLRAGQAGSIFVIARLADSSLVRLRIHGKVVRSGEAEGESIAAVDLKELSEQDWESAQRQVAVDQDFGMFDALFIDGSFFSDDPGASIDGLLELLKRADLIESRETIAFIVLAEERSRLRPGNFRLRTVNDFIYKPLDRKMLAAKLAIQVKGLTQQSENVDLIFRKAGKTGRVTKEVMMEELSEFGLQIRHETPLKERSFLRFFSSVFLDEAGVGLLGRCQFSVKDESGGHYHCFFSFFGATDAQLKHIRNWIRGDYASRKEKSGS